MNRVFVAIFGCCFLASGSAPSEPAPVFHDLIQSVLALPTYQEARSRTPPLNVRRHDVTVFRFDRLPWEKIEVATIASGEYAPDPDGSYGVHLSISCHPGDEPASQSRQLWYVFVGGQLTSFDHFEIDEACGVRAAFRRHSSLEADIDFLKYLRSVTYPPPPPGSCGASEGYQRALAYANVTRWEEARALLAFGDESVQVDTHGKLVPGSAGGECLEAAQERRRAAVRRLASAPAAVLPIQSGSP